MIVNLQPGECVTVCSDCPCALDDCLGCNLNYRVEWGEYRDIEGYQRFLTFSRECGLAEIRMTDAESIAPTKLTIPGEVGA